ncbi:MAG: glycoside hydrolase family 25 protein [Lachnospiraceae bacterium]|nr:glycoside hydrolase family 25 protein [Lachnospiraceae bacterium]
MYQTLCGREKRPDGETVLGVMRMIDKERDEQEAYERGYDIEELVLQTQSGKQTFREMEQERDSLEEQNQKLRSRKQLWMILTFVTATILLTLCIVFFISSRNRNNGGKEPENGTTETGTKYRLCEDVESKIAEFNSKNGTYVATKRTILDAEYVAFSYGGSSNPEFTLLYRNEYSSVNEATKSEYSCWMEASQTISYSVPYTLQDDWSLLTPEPTMINGTKYIFFVQTKNDGTTSVVVLEPGMMNAGREQNVYDAVRNWFGLSIGNNVNPLAENSNETIILTTGHGNQYTFSASEEVRELVRNMGGHALACGQHFSCEFTDDGIVVTSLLYVKEGEYYGVVTATLAPVQATLKVVDATVGAYVSFNYNDMDFNGINTPSIDYIENPVSIGNGSGEKLFLPEYKRVAKQTLNFDDDHYWKDSAGFRYFGNDERQIISRMGVDVSEHDGKIDWKKMKDAGISFAIVRVGYRGPGEGTLEADKNARDNIEGALENGLDVGVYFCTQAITEAEGIAEAEFVLDFIKDYDINWPIVFDTEKWDPKNYPSLADGPRGNRISRDQRTAVTKAFLDRIAAAGYQAMVYTSINWSILNINRDELAEYPFWLASYTDKVTYRYDFNIWQYTSEGKVNGLTCKFDLNVLVKPWN